MPLNAKDIYRKAHEWDAVGDDPRSIDEVDPTCRACSLRYSEAGEHCSVESGATDPEALRVVLDAAADAGCISSVTVDEEAWKALGRPTHWRRVDVFCRSNRHPGVMSKPGGWLLRPLSGYEGLRDRGVAARRNPAGFWALADRNRPAQHGDLLALQWGGDIFGTSLVGAEEYLALAEGREPMSFDELRKLWPAVEDYAMRCARPREGGQEFEPFCEIVRVDNDGREVERLLPDPAECGCCGAKGETPCDEDCDAYRQGALQ